MQLDQNPYFRKTITPWYDSSFACWLLIAAMVPVFGFALAGILVCSSHPGFSAHVWFPSLLCFLSAFLAVKIYLRLRSRTRHE